MKTFLIALTVFAVAYFILRILLPYAPGWEKESKNKWISNGVAILVSISGLVFIGAGILAWFFIIGFICKFMGMIGLEDIRGFFAIPAFFAPIIWFFSGGKFPCFGPAVNQFFNFGGRPPGSYPNPHDYGCGDRRPPGYDGP